MNTAATHRGGARERDMLALTADERWTLRVWSFVRRLLFRPSPPFMYRYRAALLRLFGAQVDPGAQVHPRAVIRQPWRLILEANVVIHDFALLDCSATVRVGEGARISQYAHLCTLTHDEQDASLPLLARPIRIGAYAWIAADAYVGPGVTVGDYTIVGARADVHEDLPPNVVAVGTPARPVRTRTPPR